jgi:HPt (histidine-containing phosphotransfer) domain-containing protein
MIESSAVQSMDTVQTVLDVEHLDRMTLGDRNLEREVLQLFDRQTAMLVERLCGAPASVAASCSHTLKGSARGIGAWRLASAAEQVEHAAASGAADLSTFVDALIGAVDATRSAIARRLPPG